MQGPEDPSNSAPVRPSTSSGRVSAARLFCPACGEVTEQRVLRLARRRPGSEGPVQGLARCRRCRLTHPFEEAVRSARTVGLIVSDRDRSKRIHVELPSDLEVRLDGSLPTTPEGLRIRAIDTTEGRRVSRATVSSVATIWASVEGESTVPVSIISGARTRSVQLPFGSDEELAVGGTLEADRIPLTIIALRSRGQTYRRPGDRFRAAEIERVYGRRMDRPPLGRSAWSRDRGTESSRASSTSRSGRS